MMYENSWNSHLPHSLGWGRTPCKQFWVIDRPTLSPAQDLENSWRLCCSSDRNWRPDWQYQYTGIWIGGQRLSTHGGKTCYILIFITHLFACPDYPPFFRSCSCKALIPYRICSISNTAPSSDIRGLSSPFAALCSWLLGTPVIHLGLYDLLKRDVQRYLFK